MTARSGTDLRRFQLWRPVVVPKKQYLYVFDGLPGWLGVRRPTPLRDDPLDPLRSAGCVPPESVWPAKPRRTLPTRVELMAEPIRIARRRLPAPGCQPAGCGTTS